MQDAFTKGKHAVSKYSPKISDMFPVRWPLESLQTLAKSDLSAKACKRFLAQNAGCESESASRESVAI